MDLPPPPYKVDIGCGSKKRRGYLGVDMVAAQGVDIVVDFARVPIPLPDRSVVRFFSAHVFEHLARMAPTVTEMGRLAQDNATVEIWTPYSWSNSAFLYGHVTFMNELHWLHLGVSYPSIYLKSLYNTRWVLKEINFVIDQKVFDNLKRFRYDIAFAVRHMVNVVTEFGVFSLISHDSKAPVEPVCMTYSFTRHGDRFDLETEQKMAPREGFD